MAGDLITFGAQVLYPAGTRKPAGLVPARVPSPTAAVVILNPYSGFSMAVRAEDIINEVNGVAPVSFRATESFRKATVRKRGFREYINPLTGNTFRVALRAITKENP
ncbi:membrane protein [Microbacterium phage Eula]|uniref:membrane protein n=1 Tax=Microbacterium phage Eula TaxID=2926098 RepID=UPI00220CB6C7|nr:membrane protein [Microbacterium phage Eula]UVF61121.1 membrane protein [Microbacterium phage Eula]